MSDQNELIRHMLDALQAPSKKLTMWEESFLGSVSDQFDRKGTLSEKQFKILESIYTEKTA